MHIRFSGGQCDLWLMLCGAEREEEKEKDARKGGQVKEERLQVLGCALFVSIAGKWGCATLFYWGSSHIP